MILRVDLGGSHGRWKSGISPSPIFMSSGSVFIYSANSQTGSRKHLRGLLWILLCRQCLRCDLYTLACERSLGRKLHDSRLWGPMEYSVVLVTSYFRYLASAPKVHWQAGS